MTTETRGIDIEAWFNRLLQRLFPVWYATQAVRELPLEPMGPLNPSSHLRHHWLSIQQTLIAAQSSLADAGQDWESLHQLLGKLLLEQEVKRSWLVTAIQGVDVGDDSEIWPSLPSYAESCCYDRDWESNADFERLVATAFPESDAPHRLVYREWDGRCYWLNNGGADELALAQLHASQKQRDGHISALMTVEHVNQPALEKLRQQFWMLLMTRQRAYQVLDMLLQADLPAIIAEFESRRSDLVLLTAKKNNKSINKIILSLMNNRSTSQLIDLGRLISRQHFPLPAPGKSAKAADNIEEASDVPSASE
ncbi:hypothetical protein CHH28_19670 [Bacterioplanes sanyensis]|uniref:Uncharacterized protein n=1 Tax=Bacterioplanes sanyensis TaxID=1249553 RepID=A0A222FQS2_9GAMM|nr:DUF6685 family protein [Bacterioplanes sanyensis]ASP40751.1 hypothetical protein CHH28_19670 [Bacterioplanes sanyensis]